MGWGIVLGLALATSVASGVPRDQFVVPIAAIPHENGVFLALEHFNHRLGDPDTIQRRIVVGHFEEVDGKWIPIGLVHSIDDTQLYDFAGPQASKHQRFLNLPRVLDIQKVGERVMILAILPYRSWFTRTLQHKVALLAFDLNRRTLQRVVSLKLVDTFPNEDLVIDGAFVLIDESTRNHLPQAFTLALRPSLAKPTDPLHLAVYGVNGNSIERLALGSLKDAEGFKPHIETVTDTTYRLQRVHAAFRNTETWSFLASLSEDPFHRMRRALRILGSTAEARPDGVWYTTFVQNARGLPSRVSLGPHDQIHVGVIGTIPPTEQDAHFWTLESPLAQAHSWGFAASEKPSHSIRFNASGAVENGPLFFLNALPLPFSIGPRSSTRADAFTLRLSLSETSIREGVIGEKDEAFVTTQYWADSLEEGPASPCHQALIATHRQSLALSLRPSLP